MSRTNSPTFCIVPWTQIATNASGAYRVCCNGIPGKNLILDEKGTSLKIYKDSLTSAWTSKTYRTMRKQLLNGERPEMCTRCFREEDCGMKSARNKWNKKWRVDEQHHMVPEPKIEYIDLRLGNRCNLKCRMCNPYASSKWVKDWNLVSDQAQLVPNNRLSESETTRLLNMDWPSSEKTWENIFEIAKDIKEIYLTGGEPFLSLEQEILLKKLIENNLSGQITLKYNTNLSILPEKLIELWKDFKLTKINVSIDAEGDLLNYIRYPADWSTIRKNLNKLLELRSSGFPLQIGLHCTVQMYNILSLHEIHHSLTEQFECPIYFNILNHPHCLNIRVLPPSLKERVNRHCNQVEPLRKIIDYLNAEDWSVRYFQEFLNYTKTLDSHRKQSLNVFFPELCN